jgi:predicted adenine nucleotide alpha hydrolase (AANH) superfamily ATPase
MKLLLHACCADCMLKFAASLNKSDKDNELVVYYYNPNIHPRSEYQSRLKAIQQISLENSIKLIIPDWKPKDYFEAINPLLISPLKRENITPQKPARCFQCWNLRLTESARYANEKGFTHFSSTLITSQYQDSEKIIKIGQKIATDFGLEFYVPKIICQDLETSGFYKQFYCGCCYSLTERMEEKFD